MKTNTFIGAASMLLVVVYLLVANMKVNENESLASVLPDTTMIFLELHEGASLLKKIDSSPLGARLPGIQESLTKQNSGLGQKANAALLEILQRYRKALDSPYLDMILGGNAALALLPPKSGLPSENIQEFMKDNSVCVIAPLYSATLLEMASQLLEKKDEIYSVAIQYGNHIYHRYTFEGKRIAWVRLGELFVMAFNERQLKSCIDAADGDSKTLFAATSFQRMKEKIPKADLFIYSPLENLRLFLVTVLSDAAGWQQLILKNLRRARGFNAFGYGAWDVNGVIYDKIAVQYEKTEVSELVAKHLLSVPATPNLLQYSSEDPMAWYWSNSTRLDDFVPYLQQNSNTAASSPYIDELLLTIEDIKHEHLLEKIGGEMSLVIEKGDDARLIPVPLAVAVIPLDPVIRPQLERILEKHAMDLGIDYIKRRYGDSFYVFWREAPQDGMRPFYGFFENTLCIGNSTHLFRKIVDATLDGVAYFNTPDIPARYPGIVDSNNSIVYLDCAWALDSLHQTLQFLGTIVAIKNRRLSIRIRKILKTLVFPFLEGAKTFDKKFSRSYFQDNMVIIESSTTRH